MNMSAELPIAYTNWWHIHIFEICFSKWSVAHRMRHIHAANPDADTSLCVLTLLRLPSPASSSSTTAPSRSPARSCGACLRTGRSPGPSPPCPSSTQSAARWCRPSTRTILRPPACPSCRHRRKWTDHSGWVWWRGGGIHVEKVARGWMFIRAHMTCTHAH